MGVGELTREAAAEPKPTIEEQIQELLEAYESQIYGYIRNLLDDPEAAHDCVQDAYLRAVEHLARGKRLNSAWLYKVARNRAMDQLRQRKHSARTEVGDAVAGSTYKDATDLRVQATLNRMAPAERELLYLFVVDRIPTKQIAPILGIRSGAVRTRLTRARQRFRELYGEQQ